MLSGFDDMNSNVGENYKALYDLASSEKTVEVSFASEISYLNSNGDIITQGDIFSSFSDPIDYGDGDLDFEGTLGISLAPTSHKWTKHDTNLRGNVPSSLRRNSTNGNYQVLINGRGGKNLTLEASRVETLAHELYGHIGNMFSGKDALHNPSRVGPESNSQLESKIKMHENEALRNFYSR